MIDDEWLENWKKIILKDCGEEAVNMIFDKNNKLTTIGSFVLCLYLIQGVCVINSYIRKYCKKLK